MRESSMNFDVENKLSRLKIKLPPNSFRGLTGGAVSDK
jgi:hypothetical protein